MGTLTSALAPVHAGRNKDYVPPSRLRLPSSAGGGACGALRGHEGAKKKRGVTDGLGPRGVPGHKGRPPLLPCVHREAGSLCATRTSPAWL